MATINNKNNLSQNLHLDYPHMLLNYPRLVLKKNTVLSSTSFCDNLNKVEMLPNSMVWFHNILLHCKGLFGRAPTLVKTTFIIDSIIEQLFTTPVCLVRKTFLSNSYFSWLKKDEISRLPFLFSSFPFIFYSLFLIYPHVFLHCLSSMRFFSLRVPPWRVWPLPPHGLVHLHASTRHHYLHAPLHPLPTSSRASTP
jgi:hypothetical protein